MERGRADARAAGYTSKEPLLPNPENPKMNYEAYLQLRQAQAHMEAILSTRLSGKDKYHLVFNDACSGKLFAAANDLGKNLEWCDPDMDYEDDLLAFQRGVESLVRDLNQELAGLDDAAALQVLSPAAAPQPTSDPTVVRWGPCTTALVGESLPVAVPVFAGLFVYSGFGAGRYYSANQTRMCLDTCEARAQADREGVPFVHIDCKDWVSDASLTRQRADAQRSFDAKRQPAAA